MDDLAEENPSFLRPYRSAENTVYGGDFSRFDFVHVADCGLAARSKTSSKISASTSRGRKSTTTSWSRRGRG